MKEEATVSVCHIFTDKEDTRSFCQDADIIISAAGCLDLIRADYVRPGQVVVDVGVNIGPGRRPCMGTWPLTRWSPSWLHHAGPRRRGRGDLHRAGPACGPGGLPVSGTKEIMNNYLSPAELLASYSAAASGKWSAPPPACSCWERWPGPSSPSPRPPTNTAVYGISDTWTVRTICGLLFPFGLGLVVVTGAELFTGNCMLPLTLLEKKGGSAVLMVRNWALVFAGNALGSLLVAWLCVSCGQLDYSRRGPAVYTIRVGAAKCAPPFGSALGLGVLCNLLVCLGVLAAASARETPAA